MNAILIAIALAAPIAAPAAGKLTDAQVHSTVQAYLGSIDTPIPAARWQALGSRASTELAGIAQQGQELPTRRAKAIDGLAALSPKQAPALFQTIAADEAQPLNVRYAAVRGLGHVVPASQLLASLQPLLEKSADARVRAKAGEELTRRIPAQACPVLRAQLVREAAAVKPQFDRARDGCLGR